jgi:N-acetylmuramoyl-L-alanine amidase
MTLRLGGAARTALALMTVASLAMFAAPPLARAATPADSLRVPAGLGVSSVPVARVDGVPMLAVNELARVLGATKFWRADVRKLVLRAGEHRLTFTADNPFVLVDDRTVRLERAVVARAGELFVPVEVVRTLPADAAWPRLAYDADAGQVRVAPSAGFVGAPRVELFGGGLTTLVVPIEQTEAVAVMGRSRARFRLRVAGGLVGALPDSLPADALIRDIAVSPGPNGLTFELAIAPSATGWRLERDAAAGRVTLSILRGGSPAEEFAPEGAPGPRVLRTVVLDPGHGGSDGGVRADGLEEKSLALALARLVAEELARRSRVHAVLTRRDDRDMLQEERAEVANRAQADAVISLHFETLPDPAAGGTTAWCPPAALGSGSAAAARAAGLIALLPWRDAAVDRAVESRGLAECLTAALERRGFGPTSVRERLPLPLVGVPTPGVLLDCGTLSNPEERARLLAPGGLKALAAAITDGLLAWQKNE